VRFEDTDRYVRGRVLAALVGREPWPDGLDPGRLQRALEGLERDGLVPARDAPPPPAGASRPA
jgi:A/G-specific adenine glycosylase